MSGENSEKALQSKISDLAKEKPEGLTNEDIKNNLIGISPDVWAKAVNKLLANGTLELFQNKNQLLYKYKDPSKKTTNKGADNEEKIVYKIIEEAGSIGIWIRDIRVKSNLNQTQLNKVLKNLETKKIIKGVKSVNASKKKVYMLYEVQPDSSVTGGAWYQDQYFESEFVDVLTQQCYRYLRERADDSIKQGGGPLMVRNRSYSTGSDVHKFISELGISTVSLSESDIESILYTLVLDNKVERSVNSQGTHLYRAINSFLKSSGLVKTVCTLCPVQSRCTESGSVNPKSCAYLNNWLS